MKFDGKECETTHIINFYQSWKKEKKKLREKEKKNIMKGSKLYHVSFGDDEHFYFGSIAAIFEQFTPQRLGVSKSWLWQFGITPEKPYKNKTVIIRKGYTRRKKGNRKPPI